MSIIDGDDERLPHIRREPTAPEILRDWSWTLALGFMLGCAMFLAGSATWRVIVEMWKP